MQNNEEIVITIKDKEGNLVAIGYNNIDKRSIEVYGVTKYGLPDIKHLLDQYLVKV